MKKALSFILAAVLCFAMCTALAEDSGLSALQGTYTDLFPEFVKEEYHDYWLECIQAYESDPDTVSMYYTMLTDGYMGSLLGQEAIDTYTAENAVWDCYMENGVSRLTIDGDTISGADAEGNEVFSHTYSYIGDIDGIYGENTFDGYFHAYKTEDADAGIFTYFIFTDDSPSESFHIEYRYGDNPDALGDFLGSEYAYWMPSAILADYDEAMIKDCIKLFVDENVGGGEAEDAA